MPLFQRVRSMVLHLFIAFALLVGAVLMFRQWLLPLLQALLGLDAVATSLLRRVGVFLCAVLAYCAYVRWMEKRPVAELRLAPRMTVLAGAAGAAMIGACLLALYAAGAYVVTAQRDIDPDLLGVAMVISIAAMLEEIAYRGLMFGILERAFGTLPALWLQALVFALMHIANVEDRADPVAQVSTVVSVALLGALWALIYVHTRNLWAVAAHHAAWNYTILLTGLPLSGLEDWRAITPLASVALGSGWMTGDVFGPEAAVLTMLVVAVAIGLLLRIAHTRGRLRRGHDAEPASARALAT